MATLEEWLGGPMFAAVGAFLVGELGAEEPDDLKDLNAEHLDAIRAKLKPLQVPKFERKLAALMGGPLPVAGGAAGGAAGAEPEPEPAPAAVPEGAPAGDAAAMSDRVLNFEARTGTDLTPITGWQDKPLVSLGKSLEGVPVKDVQIHAEVAVEFGESYKLTHPGEKRSVDQLGKPASQTDSAGTRTQQDRSLSG